MTLDRFKKMFQYNYWANDKMWDYVLQLNEEQFYRPCDYSVGSVHQQVVHMMGVEELWLHRVRTVNQPLEFAQPDVYPTQADIQNHWQTIRHDWIVYLDELTEEELDEEIAVVSITYDTTFTSPRWEALAQVINHSTDHRAQTLSLIHQVGGKTDAQDFIFYAWGQ